MKKLWQKFNTPHNMMKLNGWLAVIWFIAAIPICIYLASSVPFLVFVSVYAVVTGHWSTWQASRVEVEQITGSNLNDADRKWILDQLKDVKADTCEDVLEDESDSVSEGDNR